MRIAAYKDVRFDSFAKLSSMVGSGSKWFSNVTLYYNGTSLYGNVDIELTGTAEEKIEFLKIAVETLRF